MAEFGKVDILVANHGIWTLAENAWEMSEEAWGESIDVLLTGVWKVCKAFIPKILEGEAGGAIVLTSSTSGLSAHPSGIGYAAAKHGVIGIMRTLAWELGEYDVRVNAVCPGSTRTAMTTEGGTIERSIEFRPRFVGINRNLLPEEWQEPSVISDGILWLVSDEARHVTGVALPIDSGWLNF